MSDAFEIKLDDRSANSIMRKIAENERRNKALLKSFVGSKSSRRRKNKRHKEATELEWSDQEDDTRTETSTVRLPDQDERHREEPQDDDESDDEAVSDDDWSVMATRSMTSIIEPEDTRTEDAEDTRIQAGGPEEAIVTEGDCRVMTHYIAIVEESNAADTKRSRQELIIECLGMRSSSSRKHASIRSSKSNVSKSSKDKTVAEVAPVVKEKKRHMRFSDTLSLISCAVGLPPDLPTLEEEDPERDILEKAKQEYKDRRRAQEYNRRRRAPFSDSLSLLSCIVGLPPHAIEGAD